MLDAVIKWNFCGNFSLWFGQTKLPGNVERVVSSQKLQFVDRSLLNARFNLDRDKGLQLRHYHTWGKLLIREKLAVSQGEGRNFGRNVSNVGNGYTARIELLPFGAFQSKGDYFSSDLKREPQPKLMLGFTADYNDDALRERGQLGDVLDETRDFSTLFADMVFKYNGLSIMTEYVEKRTDKNPAIYDDQQAFVAAFYTGSAINAQVGYLFKRNIEFAYRYTAVTPEAETQNPEMTQHTIGCSRYIVGHSLKVQSDFSRIEQEGLDDVYQFRLQMEVAF